MCTELLNVIHWCTGGSHWRVRRNAAACLRDIVLRFDDPMYSLQPRVSKQLLTALLDPRRSLPTHYGALQGLIAMGPSVLTPLVLPIAPQYYRMLLPVLAQVCVQVMFAGTNFHAHTNSLHHNEPSETDCFGGHQFSCVEMSTVLDALCVQTLSYIKRF